jgi:2-polyprenyl-3-methyl-5-hydroxy-6-metoxy-1,4-benzoquinol methylase
LILNEGIRAVEAASCSLCGSRGDSFYNSLRDRRFSAAGTWNLLICPDCRLVWLNPQPVEEDLGKLYVNEFWRSSEPPSSLRGLRRRLLESILASAFGYSELQRAPLRLLGRIGSVVRTIRDRVGMGISYLAKGTNNRLLDVGCSSGVFLGRMRDLGWVVTGVEPDPIAAQRARERGLHVIDGNVSEASFPDSSFDAVTLNHVLEHALDPVGLLRECWRVTAPGGRVIVITPNVESLGRRSWGAAWYHLDPPRHLFLFAARTLTDCATRAGMTPDVLRTSTRLAWQTATASRLIAQTGQAPPARYPPRSAAFHGGLFQLMEEGASLISPHAGEELLMIATKPQRAAVAS